MAQNELGCGGNGPNPARRLTVVLALVLCFASLELRAQQTGTSDRSSTSAASRSTGTTGLVYRGDRQSPMVALTFDDAPHPVYVPRLLALLRAEEVKATFFLVGDQLKVYPKLAQAIVADGHEIGNHSLTHRNLRNASPAAVETEIVGMQKLVKERLGIFPAIYRPAYGYAGNQVKRVCARERLPIVMWNVDPTDWKKSVTREMMIDNVLENTSSGSIVLFHATHEKTVRAAAELIPVLRFRGHQLVTVSALLRDREARRNAGPSDAPQPAVATRQTQRNDSSDDDPQTPPREPPPIDIPPLPPL